MKGENIMATNLTISELKKIVADLPDDMPVIIPVIDEDDCNQIFGFRFEFKHC